jgi:hypothetical protein
MERNMTNEEKAEEIALKYAREYLVSKNDSHKQNILFKESSIIECEKAALEMGKLKDEQIKAIAEIVADIFGSPYEYSPLDEDLLENEVCENCCNGSDCNDALCWLKYFEMKYKNKMTNNAK